MTLANLIATGRGRIRARLTNAGMPGIFVSNEQMTQTHADGRVWINGLLTDTIKFGATADLSSASLDAQGFTATIKDLRGKPTEVLAKRPRRTVSLMADCTDFDAVLTVSSTDGFAAAGVIHIATEAISYTGVSPTTFTGCTRGIWGTTAQYHYLGVGAGLSYPKVTDHPVGLEGRPVELALYGDGDSGTGAGTIVFRGVCARGAREEQGTWTIGIDAITRILDQSIGGDTSEPVPIRGIHYTPAVPFAFVIATPSEAAPVVVSGFFDDEYAFCAALTVEMAAATAGFGWAAGTSITASPGVGGVLFTYTLGGAGTAPPVLLTGLGAPGAQWFAADGSPAAVFILGERYTTLFPTVVPRATVGLPGVSDTVIVGAIPTGETHRIYLGGTVVPSAEMYLFIDGDGADEPTPAPITSVDVATRSVIVDTDFRALGPNTKLSIGRILAIGANVDGLCQQLVLDSPRLANAGAMPLVRAVDILASPEADSAARMNAAIGSNRNFVAFDSFTLADLIQPELRAIGCYMRIGAGGSLEFAKLKASVTTDSVDWTIGEADLVGWPTTERGQFGMTSEFELKSGWDPKENEHNGQVHRVRDVGACSPNRVSRTLQVAQLSLARNTRRQVTIEDVRAAAMPVLGLFGTEYDVIQTTVGMRYFEARIGDTVSFTSSKVFAVDGTRGVTDEIVMVVGTSFDLSTGRVSLQLLRHGQRVAGYAPEFRMDPGDASLVSGTTYAVTLQMSDYTDKPNLSDWLTVNDLVRVYEKDVTTPTSYDAEIVSFSAPNVVRIDFGGAFTMGASEWSVGPREATAYASTDPLARFMFVADTTRRLSFTDGDVDARVFSP